MDRNLTRITPPVVLVAGATGNLGGRIVAELRHEGAIVRALVRSDRDTSRLGAATQVVIGDVEDPQSLDRACEGVHVVVSALQGGPDVLVDGQLRLLRSAARAGAARFIPSDFSFDFFNVPEGDNINSDWRRSFARQAAAHRGDAQVVHVLNGCFLDMGVLFGFLGAVDMQARSFALWGDGEAPMDFTTYDDTARFTARAALDAEVPDVFRVAGDTLTFWQLKATVEAVSGLPWAVVRRGSLADLDALIAARMSADPHNLYAFLPLMYWRSMLNGNGRLTSTQNHRYPELLTTSVARYVAEHRALFAADGAP